MEAGRWRVAGESRLVNVSRDGGRHVGVDGEQSGSGLQAHLVDDERAPVTALGDVAGVAEAPQLQRTDDPIVRPETSHVCVESIPGFCYVEIPGNDWLICTGDVHRLATRSSSSSPGYAVSRRPTG